MNKRKIKKFCKKGGHYHFNKNITKMSHKMMYPFVANAPGHMIAWCKIGTCITCDHCTNVTIDWDGTPYMCYGADIGCGGAENFACKRYKLDPSLKFFKYQKITSNSPDCELKRYIDETIEGYQKQREEEYTRYKANHEKMTYGDAFMKSIIPEDMLKWINGITDNTEDDDNGLSGT